VTTKGKPGGHPAKQDPEVARTFNLMKQCVQLVQTMESKLSDEAHLHLKASALGLMFAYAELTGMPDPTEILGGKT
jgi:hypothetical protein